MNNQYNKIKTYAILRASEKLQVYLRSGNFVWFPMEGKGGMDGKSLIIYNITLNDALDISRRFDQGSVIWCNNDTLIKENRMPQNPFPEGDGEAFHDMLSRHNSILAETIMHNLQRHGLDESYEDRKTRQMLSNSTSGRGKWEARGCLYCGYQNSFDKYQYTVKKI